MLPADLIFPHSYLTGSKSLLPVNVVLILTCRQHLKACCRQKIDAACGFNISKFIFDLLPVDVILTYHRQQVVLVSI